MTTQLQRALHQSAERMGYLAAIEKLSGRVVGNNPFHPIWEPGECLAYLTSFNETEKRWKVKRAAR